MSISEKLVTINSNIKEIKDGLKDIQEQLKNGTDATAADSVHDEAAEAAAEAERTAAAARKDADENAAARKDTETGAAQEDAEAARAKAARDETPELEAQKAKFTAMVAARTASTVKLPDDTMLSLGLENSTYGDIKKMLKIPRLKILRNNKNIKDKALLERNGISSNYKDKIKGNLENAKTPVEAQAIINRYNLTLDNGMIAGTRKRKVNKSRSKFRNKSRSKFRNKSRNKSNRK